MKCNKCGAELSEDAKFCSYCGHKIENDTKTPYKKADNSSELNISRSKKDKAKIFEKWERMSLFGKGIVVAILVSFLLCIIAFLSGKIAATIIAIIQMGLITMVILSKKQIIKMPKTWILYSIFAVSLILIIPYVCLFCMSSNSDEAEKSIQSVDEPEYHVSIKVECVENLIFSKYDIDVYMNDMFEGTVAHGTSETFDLTLTKGSYDLNFVSADDDEVTGMVELDIYQDEELNYKISCAGSEISVETIVGTIKEHGKDEAPIPQSAADYEHANFEEVQQELTAAGFTNISFEVLYDIELGWTEEGEIDSISIDGNTDFEKNDIFKRNASIVITYHMPEENNPNREGEEADLPSEELEEVDSSLTIDNCPDLVTLLQLKDPADTFIAIFENKYYGQTIEFDGCISDMQLHEGYSTRHDVLIGVGDYSENSAKGPNFHLTDVNFSDMKVTNSDNIYTGLNVHIKAKVGHYDPTTTLFELEMVEMSVR